MTLTLSLLITSSILAAGFIATVSLQLITLISLLISYIGGAKIKSDIGTLKNGELVRAFEDTPEYLKNRRIFNKEGIEWKTDKSSDVCEEKRKNN